MPIADRIIVALDTSELDQAIQTVRALKGVVSHFKVGLELLTTAGAPQVVEKLHAEGAKLFLDGKFHDIPNTVKKAAESAARLGVEMFDVHASSGETAMAAAVAVRGRSSVLAVTVLTSHSDNDSRHIFGGSASEIVKRFALDAARAGVQGIVCSPKELELLRSLPELRNIFLVTPGVRPSWAATNDQQRVMTPAEAIKKGADFCVIGRPILDPPPNIGTPVAAARKIISEIEEALHD